MKKILSELFCIDKWNKSDKTLILLVVITNLTVITLALIIHG